MTIQAIKQIIAVGAGKGGVGKSTVALNLALALRSQGAQVALLDADIYGPSIPLLLNTTGVKPTIHDKTIDPIEAYGLKTLSIGNLVESSASLAWRGPMLGKVLEQLLNDANWGECDYLILDLPPGTGDVPLSICQKLSVSGVVLVTTPQDLALSDVRRAAELFKRFNVPLIGLVENMSVYHCTHCGHEEAIFGSSGTEHFCKAYQIPCFVKLPLSLAIKAANEAGNPLTLQQDDPSLFNALSQFASEIHAALIKKPRDYSRLFGKIVVEQSTKDGAS